MNAVRPTTGIFLPSAEATSKPTFYPVANATKIELDPDKGTARLHRADKTVDTVNVTKEKLEKLNIVA